MCVKQVYVLIGLALLVTTAFAQELILASIFTDHMILQREMPVPVWGTGTPGERVTVEFAGQKVTGQIGNDGRWCVTLKELSATVEPHDLVVRVGEQKITRTDVLVGEVWLASGQSNMDFGLGQANGASNFIATAGDSQFRIFSVGCAVSDAPTNVVSGKWSACASASVPWSEIGKFTAVGYFFGRDLRKALHVPVGVIRSSWGGTAAQAWTPLEGLAGDPLLKRRLDDYETAMRNYDPVKAEAQYQEALAKHKDAVAQAKAAGKPAPREPAKPMPPGPNQHSPARLYNGMIAPLVPFAIRGVIWYQGESDAGRAQEYRTLFPALIKNWRHVFGHEFPFLFVQIAPCNGMPPEIRDAQLYTWRTVTNTAMVVITDYGNAKDIHPRDKEPVGARLALAARAVAYGEKLEYSGPVFDTVKFDGNQAILSFQHLGTGLMAKGDSLKGFTMTGAKTNFVAATAIIDGQHVIVTSDNVTQPVAVRYGWECVPEVNLFNQEGLPATPFRTDE